jgi:hypothetical protein
MSSLPPVETGTSNESSVPQPSHAADQRRHPRRLTLRTGRIITGVGVIDCAILDISSGGARLLAPEGSEIPDVFRLVVDPENVSFDCKLIWNDNQTQGVAFTDASLALSEVWFLKTEDED